MVVTLYTFGCGALGELGLSRIEEVCRPDATAVVFPSSESNRTNGDIDITAISLGTDHSCALIGGCPYRWGLLCATQAAPRYPTPASSAATGSTARGSATENADTGETTPGAVLSPAPLSEWSRCTVAMNTRDGASAAEDLDGFVCDIICGGSNTYLLTRDGAVFVLGELRPPGGNAAHLRRVWPGGQAHTDPGPGGSLTPRPRVIRIAAGWRHCLLLVDGGGIHAVGDDEHGQCAGVNDGKAVVALPTLEAIVGVAAGACHSVAWDSHGIAFAWGHGGNGRLGVGGSKHRRSPAAIESIGGPVCLVSCGANFTMFVVNRGQSLWASGGNQYGQLGLGEENMSSQEAPVQLQIPRCGEEIVKIDCGVNHTLCLTRCLRACSPVANIVWAWGCAASGQCGRAVGERKGAAPPPQRRLPEILADFTPPLSRWPIAVAAGRFHSAVLAVSSQSLAAPAQTTLEVSAVPNADTIKSPDGWSSSETDVSGAGARIFGPGSWDALANVVLPLATPSSWEQMSTSSDCASARWANIAAHSTAQLVPSSASPSQISSQQSMEAERLEHDIINDFCATLGRAPSPLRQSSPRRRSSPAVAATTELYKDAPMFWDGRRPSAPLAHVRSPLEFEPPQRGSNWNADGRFAMGGHGREGRSASSPALQRPSSCTSSSSLPVSMLLELGEAELKSPRHVHPSFFPMNSSCTNGGHPGTSKNYFGNRLNCFPTSSNTQLEKHHSPAARFPKSKNIAASRAVAKRWPAAPTSWNNSGPRKVQRSSSFSSLQGAQKKPPPKVNAMSYPPGEHSSAIAGVHTMPQKSASATQVGFPGHSHFTSHNDHSGARRGELFDQWRLPLNSTHGGLFESPQTTRFQPSVAPQRGHWKFEETTDFNAFQGRQREEGESFDAETLEGVMSPASGIYSACEPISSRPCAVPRRQPTFAPAVLPPPLPSRCGSSNIDTSNSSIADGYEFAEAVVAPTIFSTPGHDVRVLVEPRRELRVPLNNFSQFAPVTMEAPSTQDDWRDVRDTLKDLESMIESIAETSCVPDNDTAITEGPIALPSQRHDEYSMKELQVEAGVTMPQRKFEPIAEEQQKRDDCQTFGGHRQIEAVATKRAKVSSVPDAGDEDEGSEGALEFSPRSDGGRNFKRSPKRGTALREDADVCQCGSTFLEDSLFCRRCGAKRSERPKCCECGTTFVDEDSLFCRKCGTKRRDGSTQPCPKEVMTSSLPGGVAGQIEKFERRGPTMKQVAGKNAEVVEEKIVRQESTIGSHAVVTNSSMLPDVRAHRNGNVQNSLDNQALQAGLSFPEPRQLGTAASSVEAASPRVAGAHCPTQQERIAGDSSGVRQIENNPASPVQSMSIVSQSDRDEPSPVSHVGTPSPPKSTQDVEKVKSKFDNGNSSTSEASQLQNAKQKQDAPFATTKREGVGLAVRQTSSGSGISSSDSLQARVKAQQDPSKADPSTKEPSPEIAGISPKAQHSKGDVFKRVVDAAVENSSYTLEAIEQRAKHDRSNDTSPSGHAEKASPTKKIRETGWANPHAETTSHKKPKRETGWANSPASSGNSSSSDDTKPQRAKQSQGTAPGSQNANPTRGGVGWTQRPTSRSSSVSSSDSLAARAKKLAVTPLAKAPQENSGRPPKKADSLSSGSDPSPSHSKSTRARQSSTPAPSQTPAKRSVSKSSANSSGSSSSGQPVAVKAFSDSDGSSSASGSPVKTNVATKSGPSPGVHRPAADTRTGHDTNSSDGSDSSSSPPLGRGGVKKQAVVAAASRSGRGHSSGSSSSSDGPRRGTAAVAVKGNASSGSSSDAGSPRPKSSPSPKAMFSSSDAQRRGAAAVVVTGKDDSGSSSDGGSPSPKSSPSPKAMFSATRSASAVPAAVSAAPAAVPTPTPVRPPFSAPQVQDLEIDEVSSVEGF